MGGVEAQLRALVAALAACAVIAGPAHAAFPGPNGAIAFTRVTTVCGDPNPCMLVEVRKTGGPVMSTGSHPAWSADAQRLAFVDGDAIYAVKPDGSDRQLLFEWAGGIEGIAWAPSGERLAAALGVCDGDECRTDIHVIDLGPGGAEGVVNITPDLFSEKNPAWSPDGNRIAFDTTRDSNQEVFTMDVDGGNLDRLTTHPGGDNDPNWAPSGDALAFTSTRDGEDAIYRMGADGSGQTRLTGLGAGGSRQPAWSPDGTQIVFSGIRGEIRLPQLVVISANGGTEFPSGASQGQSDFEPDWQPTSIAYARPRSASPLKVSLVPSFVACTAPNRTHGPPLAFDSCNPPSQFSPNVTVGTPDANGAAAGSVGFARFRVWPPFPNSFDTDFDIELTLSDVRCGSGATTCGPANDRGGPDYTGEVQLEHLVRLTEKTQPSDPTTLQDFRFRVDTTCSGTSSTATGAICSIHTSANAVAPGAVHDGRRTIWQMGPVRVLDGGADGNADTAGDNRLFAKQGVFIP